MKREGSMKNRRGGKKTGIQSACRLKMKSTKMQTLSGIEPTMERRFQYHVSFTNHTHYRTKAREHNNVVHNYIKLYVSARACSLNSCPRALVMYKCIFILWICTRRR